MTAMTIDNYEDSADLFTFPNNPYVFDDTIVINNTVTKIPYGIAHVHICAGGIDPKPILLSGHFNEAKSADKRVDYNTLAKHISEAKLKKLHFASDRFYICLGGQIKQTNLGGRTGFIDYVASFNAVIGILFGTTQRTSGTNAGSFKTFVEEITGTCAAGNTFTITDNHDNGITVDPDGTTGAIVIKLVTMINSGSGIKVSKFMYCTVGGTEVSRARATGKNSMYLEINPSENVSTITTSGDIASATIKFRDGYLG